MTSPSAETNDPEPPLLNRTLECCTCSSQAFVGLKLYFSCSSFVGGLLNSHIPSSAERRSGAMKHATVTAIKNKRQILFIGLHLLEVGLQFRAFFVALSVRRLASQNPRCYEFTRPFKAPRHVRISHRHAFVQPARGFEILQPC